MLSVIIHSDAEFVNFHFHIFNCMLVSVVLDKKIHKRYVQIFYYFTLTEHPKKAREV